MGDRPLAAGEVVVLHRLSRHPGAVACQYALIWRLEREGLLAPAPGGMAVTDAGVEALAKALTSRPRFNPDAVMALSAIQRADAGGLRGCWPGPAAGMDAARLFGLVRSLPPDAGAHERATWQLTEAGKRHMEHLRAARRAAAPMSRTQANVVRAVAVGQLRPAAADRSYTSCHHRGWLTWTATSDHGGGLRRQVTPAGWRALVGYHRRENLPLRLPVRFLVPGHVARLARQATDTNGPVRVAGITQVTTTAGSPGYLILADGPPSLRPAPYPDGRALPPATSLEVVDYQP